MMQEKTKKQIVDWMIVFGVIIMIGGILINNGFNNYIGWIMIISGVVLFSSPIILALCFGFKQQKVNHVNE